MPTEILTDMVGELRDALTRIAGDDNTSPEHRAAAKTALDRFASIGGSLEEAVDTQFVAALSQFCARMYSNSHSKGFWPADHMPGAPGGRNDGEAIALLHSEVKEVLEPLLNGLRLNAALSDLLEAVRSGADVPSTKIPDFTLMEEEAADVLIRLCEWAHGRGLRLAEAAVAKHAYNTGRPYKHGRKF